MTFETPSEQPLEIWGGIECTVNRVGDVYYDQMERNGHANRISDLDRIQDLGITAIRYPVLWERLAPDGLDSIDWSWSDERLSRLRELGIQPIVGLVHHGSGPRHTSLIESSFAPGLADFSRAVAERYPWVEHYTPVNEPLTTARFSGLYGVWYPHGHDEATFARAYINQLRAIILAMREIRQVNPDAKLVQTEDIGKTHSTPLLAYQADFENERRWLTFDILSGNFNRNQPGWDYLRRIGISNDELTWFAENPCPPDVMGVNHYLTSERYLDERLDQFPEEFHGGNGQHHYADVEAVRVSSVELAGFGGLLQEAWERYHSPLAITELHLGCTRDEQLRWFYDGWKTSTTLRQAGVDIRAVTAWSLLGSFDWNCLVTSINGYYEPGVFDVRGSDLRPTALAKLIRELANGEEPDHPALAGARWWKRDNRWFYRHDDLPGAMESLNAGSDDVQIPPIAAVGDIVTDESLIARLCHVRGLPFETVRLAEIDQQHMEHILDPIQPWAIVTELIETMVAGDGGVSPVKPVDEQLERLRFLGRYCAERNINLLVLSVSSDSQAAGWTLGEDRSPLLGALPMPATPEEFDQHILDEMPDSLIVRTSPGMPVDGATGTVDSLLHASPGIPLPIPAEELLNVSLDLLIDGERGVWDLGLAG